MALADMPEGCDTVLSMGANGQWYFDWFDDNYGHIPRHFGVEAYMPRPDVLPDNVEWVEADLASPEGVAMIDTESVDLVFSGQNIEHLWPDQVEAFLVESNRVLRDGGWLVVDSPNRDLTSAYQWSMGEHTIEFTPDEAADLLRLAGFEVVTMKGIWLCRQNGELLPLERLVRKLSLKNAQLYGLNDRGQIAVGKRADINVIDHARLALHMPRIAHDLPKGSPRMLQGASGYLATMVGGVLTRRNDAETGARPGRLIRSGAALH